MSRHDATGRPRHGAMVMATWGNGAVVKWRGWEMLPWFDGLMD
ncbi:hypothetical protein [Magnetofaba australis]|nr:hypothetical protein [Magnetofaba australis]